MCSCLMAVWMLSGKVNGWICHPTAPDELCSALVLWQALFNVLSPAVGPHMSHTNGIISQTYRCTRFSSCCWYDTSRLSVGNTGS